LPCIAERAKRGLPGGGPAAAKRNEPRHSLKRLEGHVGEAAQQDLEKKSAREIRKRGDEQRR